MHIGQNIDSSRLLLQMKLMAAKAENQATFGAQALGSDAAGQTSFQGVLKESLGKVNDLQVSADNKIDSYIRGDNTDLPDTMISAQKASLAVTFVKEISKKGISAYQEIMNMTV